MSRGTFMPGQAPNRRRHGLSGTVPLVAGLLLALAVAPPPAVAQSTVTWIGGGSDANWLTAENWNGTAPVNSGTRALIFDGALLTTNTNNATSLTASSITFNTAGFTLSGSAITLSGNINNLAESGTQTISLPISLASGTRNVTGTTGSVINLTGQISGAGGITVNRTVTLSASNSYLGNTLVNASARVNIGHAFALGNGTLQFESGGMSFDNSSGAPLTIGNALFNRAATGGAFFIGTNDLTTTGTYRTNASGQELIVQNNVLTVGGLETGGATVVLTKEGTGTLRVTGPAGPTLSSATAGGIRVVIGGIAVAHPLALGTAGPLRFAGIAGSGPNELIVETDLTGTNALSVPIILEDVSALTTISGSYGVTFTGPWTINRTASPFNRNLRNSLTSGTLRIEGSVSAGATTQPYQIVFEGTGPTVISGPILQPIGNTTSLTKNDSGSLTLSGSATYSGTTTVNGGLLLLSTTAAVTGTAAKPYTVAAAATLATGFALDQSFLNKVATTSAGVMALGTNSGNDLDFSATGANLANVSLGAVGAGTQAYSGALTPDGTTYRLGGGGGTLDFQGSLSGGNSLVLGGPTTGLGGAVLLSSATANANSYTGKTTLQTGTLEIASIANVGGGNSSLGAPTTAASGTIDLGSGTAATTLRYVGPGHSTDRVLNLTGGPLTLDASGSGTVAYTSAMTGGGSSAVTLTGTNMERNFIRSVAGGDVTKTGVGTWVLGTSSYSGTLRVEQGTLVAAGSAASGSGVFGTSSSDNRPVIGVANSSGTAALLVTGGFTISRGFDVAAAGTGDQEAIIGGTGPGISKFGAIGIGLGRNVTLTADAGHEAEFNNIWQTLAGGTNPGPAVAFTVNSQTATGTVTFMSFLPESITAVNVRRGTLRLTSGADTLGPGTPLTVGSGLGSATVDLANNPQALQSLSFGGTAGLVVPGGGSGLLRLAGATPTVTAATGAGHRIESGIALDATATFDVAAAAARLTVAAEIADGLNGARGLVKSGSGTLAVAGVGTFTGTTTVNSGTLTVTTGGRIASSARLDVASDATLAFARADGYGGGYGNVISGAGNLAVQSGTLRLTGINTFTGASSVLSGAVLELDGRIDNATLDVASGATLMGSGTIAGQTTIAGLHRPGNSPGIQSLDNLSYTSGASVQWELWRNTVSNTSVAYDQIILSGDLDFAGPTTFNLAFTGSASPTSFSEVVWSDSFWNSSREWLVYDVSGTTTGFDTNLALVQANWLDSTSTAFQTARPGNFFALEQRASDVYLVYSAVIPEPGTLALAAIGLAAAAWARVSGGPRRRRR